MNQDELIKAFVDGKTMNRWASSLHCDGDWLFSYGTHFPLAVRLKFDDEYLFFINEEKYSSTTSKHQSYVRRHTSDKPCITFDHSGYLVELLRSNELKVAIEDSLEMLAKNGQLVQYLKSNGVNTRTANILVKEFNDKVMKYMVLGSI